MKVYRDILLTKNDKIPLIFGSTFMTEIVEAYPGKKAHFVLSQDELNPFLLDISQDEILLDAPTIATMLLQILLCWTTKTIVFVGQNLAFRGKAQYAEGITYAQHLNRFEKDKDRHGLISATSVTGEEIYTIEAYQTMRESLEYWLEMFERRDVINTTIDGVHIEGTVFMRLADVMEQELKGSVVSENWFDEVISTIPNPDIEAQQKKYTERRKKFLASRDEMNKQIHRLERILKSMEKNIRLSKLKPTIRDSDKYERTMSQVEENNLYYCTLIVPFLTIYLVQQNAKLVELGQKVLPDMEYYKIKYEIIKEAVDTITHMHHMINQDVEKILGTETTC